MNIIETTLTKQERRMLRTALFSRIVIFFLMILPIMVFSFYILYLAIMSFVDGDQDMFSYIVPILFILFYFAVGKFILPQYKNLFRYGTARTKQIIETTVLEISHRHIGRTGIVFNLQTDYGTINTARNVVFFYDISLLDIHKGMKIYIHIVPKIENEILRITPYPNDTEQLPQDNNLRT